MAQTSDLLHNYALQPTVIKNIISEFEQPIHKNRFFNNLEYLIDSAVVVPFNKKNWFLRPEFFCYDYYGEPNYFPVVLLVNNITSRFNFRAENFRSGIYAPSTEAIRDSLSQSIR